MTYKKLIITFILFPLTSFSFGPIGHRAVGLVAQANLSPRAQLAVKELLGNESLADVANWADKVRGEGKVYQQANWYHFEKMPDNTSYIDNLRIMPPEQRLKGGVIVAILAGFDALRSPVTPAQERMDALKFLVHFVGDVHQPLHTGRNEDLGGNKIEVNWFGTPTNLHSIWDSGLIIVGHSAVLNPALPIDAQSVNYARYLISTFSRFPVDFRMNAEGWLYESIRLRDAAYNEMYATNQPQYLNANLNTIDFRVYQAGIRLAAALNQIFQNSPMQSVEKDLWMRASAILGDFRKYIFFRP